MTLKFKTFKKFGIMWKYLFVIRMVTSFSNAFAQTNLHTLRDFYIYPEYEKGYSSKTRSFDGNVGQKYWQNKAKYNIEVKLDTESYELKGSGTIKYFNNSPDSISIIVFRSYPDFYKCSALKDNPIINTDCSLDGMQIDNLKINGLKHKFDKVGTNIVVKLNGNIYPHDSIDILISWRYFFPRQTRIREGVYFNSNFLVAYWYPQISVYDDIDGWDFFNYTGLQEFYNDFNDYDVRIEASANFMVWATGVWQNPKEIFNNECLKKYEASLKSDTVIHVIDNRDRTTGNFFLSNTHHMFHFKANSINDFTFILSDSYVWDAISVNTKKKLDSLTTINLVYNLEDSLFNKLTYNSKKTIEYLTDIWPKISYPYNNIILFQGEGGMEYPMIISQGYYDDFSAASTNSHEISHSYFPFLVGTNERKYAWMDEQWAQTLPNDCILKVQGKEFKPQQLSKELVQYFNKFAGTVLDVPPMVPSIILKGNSYYFATYTKPFFALYYLKDFLGDSLFLSCLRAYINRWNGKHPSPYDFFFTFNNISKQNLNWYWKAWYFEYGYADLCLKSVYKLKKHYNVVIKKIGTLPIPFKCEILYKDGSSKYYYKTADVWRRKDSCTFSIPLSKKKISKIYLNTDLIPDKFSSNNTFSF